MTRSTTPNCRVRCALGDRAAQLTGSATPFAFNEKCSSLSAHSSSKESIYRSAQREVHRASPPFLPKPKGAFGDRSAIGCHFVTCTAARQGLWGEAHSLTSVRGPAHKLAILRIQKDHNRHQLIKSTHEHYKARRSRGATGRRRWVGCAADQALLACG